MKIGILLSGCGVYDGAEIQESVLTMLAIEEAGHDYICIGVDKDQHHVINHINGEVMAEKRNMLIEAARIARGEIVDIENIIPNDLDALVIPGGFGSAKNLSSWAFQGADGSILPSVKKLILELYQLRKIIIGLCVSPVVLAKAFEDSGVSPHMTIGSNQEKSPYDIDGFAGGMAKVGAQTEMKTIREILIDKENRIITAPCYMMDATISEIYANITQAIRGTENLMV